MYTLMNKMNAVSSEPSMRVMCEVCQHLVCKHYYYVEVILLVKWPFFWNGFDAVQWTVKPQKLKHR